MVILLATRVHGLVHVVDPGLVPDHVGGPTRAAAVALAPVAAPIRRAPAGVPAAVPAHVHALGIEVLSKYTPFLTHNIFCIVHDK